MAKHKSKRRPKPVRDPQQPRDRLTEIRAEIREVQQQIDDKRHDPRIICSAEDLKAWERSLNELSDRLAALLLAEAMQNALGDPENRRQARSLAQGAGHTLKDQGPPDVTLRTAGGQVDVRVSYFIRNCDQDKAGIAIYPSLLLWGVHDRCTAGRASEVSKHSGDDGLVGKGRAGPARSGTTPGPQDDSGDRLSVRHARPYRPACGEFDLGRNRRGPSRGPVHHWGPDPDSHDQTRPEDRQGTPPLSRCRSAVVRSRVRSAVG